MPNTRSNPTFEFLSLSNVKHKRKLQHDDSIRLAKRKKRCPLRKKKDTTVDVNNCSFTSDQNDDAPEVSNATFFCVDQQEQAHENFIEVVFNATFVYDNDQQGQAHYLGVKMINSWDNHFHLGKIK